MKNIRPQMIDFAVLLFWVSISMLLAWSAYSLGGVDFNVYYAAGRVTLQGGNPYDYNQLATEIVSVTQINNPYYYAPWFTWSLLPLALLPYATARILWAVVNFSLWLLALFNLQKIVAWPPSGWKRWGMHLFVTVLFAWTAWGFEQVGILIFFLMMMSLLALKQEKWNAAGIWLALLLFKPNITALPVAAILLWFVLKKNWRPAFVTGAATLTMVAISLMITPSWFQALLTPDKLTGLSYKFNESGVLDTIRYNTTLKDWLAVYNVTGITANGIYAFIIISGLTILGWTIFHSPTLVQVTSVALLVTYAITPYTLYYDYPALTLTIFHANDVTFRKPGLKWIKFALNLFVMASLFIGTTISFRYWTTIAVAILMVFKYTAKPFDVLDSDLKNRKRI